MRHSQGGQQALAAPFSARRGALPCPIMEQLHKCPQFRALTVNGPCQIRGWRHDSSASIRHSRAGRETSAKPDGEIPFRTCDLFGEGRSRGRRGAIRASLFRRRRPGDAAPRCAAATPDGMCSPLLSQTGRIATFGYGVEVSLRCLLGIHRPSPASIARRPTGYTALCESCGLPLERQESRPWRAATPIVRATERSGS